MYVYFLFLLCYSSVSLSPMHQMEKIFKIFLKNYVLETNPIILKCLLCFPAASVGCRRKGEQRWLYTCKHRTVTTMSNDSQKWLSKWGKWYDGNFFIEMSEFEDYFLVTEALFSIDICCIQHIVLITF